MGDWLHPQDLTALWLTLRLAAVTTIVLLILGTPLAWWLARTRSRCKLVIESLVALPLVLPPTVLGFYVLLMLGPQGPIQALGGPAFAFTFTGLVIGSVLYSLPFVVQPLQNAFVAVGDEILEAAAALRAGPWDRFASVVLPLSLRGFLTATTLGFAHTVGEFGVVLMIGGNIPGETQVVSIAIYDHVEAVDYRSAHMLSALLLGLSFVMLLLLYMINGRYRIGATNS
ncbi:molybdenum ABC transporter permease subunit [Alkalilimnicola ehrlichii]|uniref:Molybdenum transport system permease n=1 Tax=Alkalilimnicola ehrlichii TaxID=351052 RepID=A0A3E0X167_9GAMM|nr:molybdate ABC transporter permease subunit [Alkalilimnicola ehrlichii]RFA30343.1 molybdenum ABC transporter permease subunit [Alkalilimnicola ehrlichii]RFA37917.1 molybdenum ABC transporter permease subunit [Alkalilimnicola ehrlichii]